MSEWSGKSKIMLQMLLCLLLASTAFAGAVTDSIERSFRVDFGGRLTIDSERGAIEVRTAERKAVDVLIQRSVKMNDKRRAEEILKGFVVTFEQKGSDVQITTVKHKRGNHHGDSDRNRLQVHFVVTVPFKYNVDLRTEGGNISVADLEGEVQSQTSGGDLRFGEIKGVVWGRTSGGSIELTRCKSNADVETSGGIIVIGNVDEDLKAKTSGGSLRFGEIKGAVWGRTSGGSIELTRCKSNADVETSGGSIVIGNVDGEVKAKTSGGSIRIDRAGSATASASGGGIAVGEVMGQIVATTSGGAVEAYISRQPKEDSVLKTSGGNVTVYLTSDIAVDVDARTDGGQVSTDFPVAIVVQGTLSKNQLQGTINGGGPRLELHTSGGNVYLRQKHEE